MGGRPYILIISGPAGSGKTSTAIELWKTLPVQPAYICLDHLKDMILPSNSTDQFLDLASKNALSLAQNFLNEQHSVILVKAFGKYEFVEPFIVEGEKRDISSFYFKLTAPLNTLLVRNRKRRSYTLDQLVKEMRWRTYSAPDERIKAIYEFHRANAHPEGIEIDTTHRSLQEVVTYIRTEVLHSLKTLTRSSTRY